MRLALRILAAAALLCFAGAASAVPLTISPGQLAVSGPVKAVFLYKEAKDTSELWTSGFTGKIFDNQADSIGTVKDLGTLGPGSITFELKNLSQNYSFYTDVPSGANYYAKYSTNYADFGLGAMSDAAAAAIASDAILSTNPLLFVAFEDRSKGDFDYDDLIFAFASISVTEESSLGRTEQSQPGGMQDRGIGVTQVPEPGSLALLGIGLLAFATMRRSRQR